MSHLKIVKAEGGGGLDQHSYNLGTYKVIYLTIAGMVKFLNPCVYFASPLADERLEPEDIEKSWDISSSFLILSWDIHR